jgi:tetratricopeptide (TPR) repeat protein
MSRDRTRKPQRVAPPPAPPSSTLGRVLGGQPHVSEIVALLAVVLVIGVSAGYLVVRFAGGAPAQGVASADPAAPWRARLAQDPGDLAAMLGLAHVHLDQQQLDEAERLYGRVLSMDQRNAEAITHLGTIFLSRGQVDEALRRYDDALRLQPTYVHALWDKAHLLQQVKRDYPGAIRTWEAFIQQVGPDSEDAKTAGKYVAEARKAMAAP